MLLTGLERTVFSFLPNNHLCLSYKCNKLKILIKTGQSHHTSITGFIIQIPWFGKNHFCFWKHWLLVFTTPRIAKQGLFFDSPGWTVPKNSTKTYAVSELTEINRVSGCHGIKTMKMGVHFFFFLWWFIKHVALSVRSFPGAQLQSSSTQTLSTDLHV